MPEHHAVLWGFHGCKVGGYLISLYPNCQGLRSEFQEGCGFLKCDRLPDLSLTWWGESLAASGTAPREGLPICIEYGIVLGVLLNADVGRKPKLVCEKRVVARARKRVRDGRSMRKDSSSYASIHGTYLE